MRGWFLVCPVGFRHRLGGSGGQSDTKVSVNLSMAFPGRNLSSHYGSRSNNDGVIRGWVLWLGLVLGCGWGLGVPFSADGPNGIRSVSVEYPPCIRSKVKICGHKNLRAIMALQVTACQGCESLRRETSLTRFFRENAHIRYTRSHTRAYKNTLTRSAHAHAPAYRARAHTHTHMHTHAHTQAHAHTRAHSLSIHHTHAHWHAHEHNQVRTRVHTANEKMCARARTRTHARTYTHARTRTHL